MLSLNFIYMAGITSDLAIKPGGSPDDICWNNIAGSHGKFVLFTKYRVAQQCCPGGNRPETPRRPSAGGLRIFWAKSLVIPAIYTKFKLMAHKFKVEFCIYGWNYQWFSPKNPETPCGGSPGGLRTISAVTTLLVHTVCLHRVRNIKLCSKLSLHPINIF